VPGICSGVILIVAISDVHLGYEKCNKKEFEDFIDRFLAKEDIEHLVLLGDILDFWRRLNEGVLFENMQILYRLSSLPAEVHYVIGNHDYYLCCLKQYKTPQFEFTDNLVLESGGKKFRFIHGHQIEFGDLLPFYEEVCQVLCTSGDKRGQILSDLWDFYETKIKVGFINRIKDFFSRKKSEVTRFGQLENLNRRKLNKRIDFILQSFEERERSPLFRKELFEAELLIAQYDESINLQPDEILVYGHTHKPFVKKDKANTGCWVSGCDNTNSYLIIDDGKMELHYWGKK
jgi:UDP-2,3-diacylglucosamine pyrophosphatase LpxH